MKITATWLEARREPKNRPTQRYDVTVDGREGLMVRVFPSGAVGFRFRYTDAAGKRRVMVLGEFGKGGLTLAEAHELHHQAQRELEKGLDPIEEREKRLRAAERTRAERAGADTIAKLVEQFVRRELRAERWDESRGAWVATRAEGRKRPDAAAALLGYRPPDAPVRRHKKAAKRVPTFVSELGSVKAPELTKRQIIAFLDSIVDRNAPVMANRIYALLKQFFEWAAEKDRIPASPMAGVKPPGGTERPRDRILSAEEVRAVWAKLDTAAMAVPTCLALKLLLATGQRRGELTHARWDHFDLEGKLWTIPVSLLKSAHSRRETPAPHVVPLSDLALDLLRKLQTVTGAGAYVLPQRGNSKREKSYSERVLSRAVRENEKHFGIPHWTPHDLRRTAASHMTKLGVPRLHVEKVLNHSTGDIAEVYDRHDYLREKRAALEKWGAHLQTIIEGRDENAAPNEQRA
jgi:integrase